MKKIVSLVLALSMVLSMFASAFASTTFEDVEAKYAGAVEALVELGIVNGMPDGTFKPENEVTRAELAKMLVISLGLGDEVDALAGKTIFSDVDASHWASKYINAAVQSKVIAGYPDGTFKPEKEVSYAEAYTMMLRTLNYGNVVDSEGTWPTAYLQKAVELGLNKDVDGDKANTAAIRGNIAIMMWNMLRTNMWRIASENEGTGMTSRPSEKIMLEIKFPDYSYGKTVFTGYTIEAGDEEAEINMYFGRDAEQNPISYVYDDVTDFYTFVPGTEVEVLLNVEEGELLSIVATQDNKLVEGVKDEIDEDYDELKATEYDYAYALIKQKAILASNVLSGDSEVVDELDIEKDYVKINKGERLKDKDWDYKLVLKDGERASLRDLEVGDVLTTVTVSNGDTFYVIGSEEVEGELKRYEDVKYENSDLTFEQLTLDSDKYVVAEGATYVEDPEDEDCDPEVFYGNDQRSKMEGEEVVAVLDAMFGKVVRVNFDGEINSGEEEETSFKFFAVADGVDKSGKTYNIVLENEEESNTYDFAKNSDAEAAAKRDYANGVNAAGSFVWVELDDEDNILNLVQIAFKSGDAVDTNPVKYGESGDNEFYKIVEMLSGSHNKDEKDPAISGDEGLVKVDDNTVLVKLVFDDNGTKAKKSDDEYRVEFVEDAEALRSIKNEHVLVIYDAAETFVRAKYVVVWSDTSSKTDNKVDKVISLGKDPQIGANIITLGESDDESIDLRLSDETPANISEYELVVYTITTNKDKEIFNFVDGLTSGDLSASGEYDYYVYAVHSNGTTFKSAKSGEEYDFTSEAFEAYEDYMVVEVDVERDNDDVSGESYNVNSYEVVEDGVAGMNLSKGDRIFIGTEEVIFVVSGMEKLED